MTFIKISGACYEFKGVNGKTYKLAPLGLKELGEFVLWCKFYPMKEVFEEAKYIDNREKREEFIDKKRQEIANRKERINIKTGESISQDVDITNNPDIVETDISLDSPSVMKLVSSPIGMAKLIYLSLRINQPELDEGEISKIVNINNIKETKDAVDLISGLTLDTDSLGE